ncbi:MAG: hypothetical protein RSE18_02325 [Acinetobacter sp.]
MALVTKNDVTQIFAIQAPEVDLPPTFANYPRGWDTARSNNGKPTIKQFNYIQQRTDQNVLWIHQNGAALPYDAAMEYAENAHVVKDGELQKKQGASWVSATNKGYNLDYFAPGKSYPLHAEIMLTNGDTVKSIVANNIVNPNVDMTGWVNETEAQRLISYASRITPRQFGGKPNDPLFDNYQALTDCINDGRPIFLDGKYYTSKPIVGRSQLNISGVNQQESQIVKTTTLKSGLSPNTIVVGGNTKTDVYDVDAVLILKPNQVSANSWEYAQSVNLSHFSLQRTGVDTSDTTLNSIGFYAPRICQSQFKEFSALNKIGHGIYCANPWMNSWIRCEAQGRIPWCMGRVEGGTSNDTIGGTSNSFISCWARDAKKTPYKIGLQYSVFEACGADNSGSTLNPIDYVFDIESSNITIIASSAEIVKGKLLRAAAQSKVTVIAPTFNVSISGDGTTDALVLAEGGGTHISIVGGIISPSGATTNTYFSAIYGATLSIDQTETPQVFDGFVTTLTNTNKAKLHILEANSRINYLNKGVELSDVNGTTDPISLRSGGFSVKSGGFINTGIQGNFGITNFDGGTYNTNLFRLGRIRLWRSVVNTNASGIFHKIDSDPTTAENGTLLNSFRGLGTTFPADPTTCIAGQYFYRTDLEKIFIFSGFGWKDVNGVNASSSKPLITGKITPTTLAEQNTVLSSIVSALVALNLVTDGRA